MSECCALVSGPYIDNRVIALVVNLGSAYFTKWVDNVDLEFKCLCIHSIEVVSSLRAYNFINSVQSVLKNREIIMGGLKNISLWLFISRARIQISVEFEQTVIFAI